MTLNQQVLSILNENPTITNVEIAKELGEDEKFSERIKTIIYRLKKQGKIVVSNHGANRKIDVIGGLPSEKFDLKREIYEEMLEIHMEDFRNVESWRDRKEIGSLVLRILEKL